MRPLLRRHWLPDRRPVGQRDAPPGGPPGTRSRLGADREVTAHRADAVGHVLQPAAGRGSCYLEARALVGDGEMEPARIGVQVEEDLYRCVGAVLDGVLQGLGTAE